MALLPGEKLVMASPEPDNDRADVFSVYDLEGNLLKEWSMWGAIFRPSPEKKVSISG